jgi:FkbM family methyltransferase
MKQETLFALTSLSPAPASVAMTQDCIRSWRSAGLDVRAFNHPAEIEQLARLYDVTFVPMPATTAGVFGRHYVKIKAMTDWAVEQDAPVLLINSDIYLALANWEIKRVRWLSNDGLCYFVRYNHAGDVRRAVREPFGIDGFLFHGRNAAHLPDSFLSMGQPFWDYWLPYAFALRGQPIAALEYPAAFHRSHQTRWSWENWHRCALEFARIAGVALDDHSFEACVGMSWRVRQVFERAKVSVPQRPFSIREWVQQRFHYRGPKTFLELGAHQGTDTAWMAQIPDVTIHAFEPDPRNHQTPRHNVTLHRAAIAERDGRGSLILSRHGWGQEWTHSSSIKQPKNHLQRYPVSFGGAVEVELVALDTFCRQQGLDTIDFIWADIQGAEGEMILGGQQTLARTRYLYTEYSDDELYENQATLRDILALLPDFRVVELWPDDVLLENRRLAA